MEKTVQMGYDIYYNYDWEMRNVVIKFSITFRHSDAGLLEV